MTYYPVAITQPLLQAQDPGLNSTMEPLGPACVLGIDLGTSSVKAALLEETAQGPAEFGSCTKETRAQVAGQAAGLQVSQLGPGGSGLGLLPCFLVVTHWWAPGPTVWEPLGWIIHFSCSFSTVLLLVPYLLKIHCWGT